MTPCALSLPRILTNQLPRNDQATATNGRRQVNVLLVLVAPGRHHTPQPTNLITLNAKRRKEIPEEKETAVLPTLVAQIREVDIPLEALTAQLEATPRNEAVPSLAMEVVTETVATKTLAVAPLAEIKTRIVEPSRLAKAKIKEISLNLACDT